MEDAGTFSTSYSLISGCCDQQQDGGANDRPRHVHKLHLSCDRNAGQIDKLSVSPEAPFHRFGPRAAAKTPQRNNLGAL